MCSMRKIEKFSDDTSTLWVLIVSSRNTNLKKHKQNNTCEREYVAILLTQPTFYLLLLLTKRFDWN